MGKLTYGAIMSLDGYIADEQGEFDWGMPDPEEHLFVNAEEDAVDTYIYGRKLYEIMKVWQNWQSDEPEEQAYAELWQGKNKIVVSSTLEAIDTPRTTLVRSMDAPALATLTAETDGILSIGGPTLAADAIRAGLIDEFGFYVCPIVVGGGLKALPDGLRLELELVEERRFGNGVVYTRYLPR